MSETETAPIKPKNPYQFYVSSNPSGLWVVDLEAQPPKLLNHSSLDKRDFKDREIEHDIGDRTIQDFAKTELEAKHIKEIRPTKIVFSTKLPFCDWVSADKDKIQCVNYGYVKNSKGKFMCKRHYSFGNNK